MSPTDIRRRPSSVSINCAMPGLQVWALKNGPHFQEQSFYDPTFLQDQRRSAPDLALLPASVELQVESSSSARPSILKVGIAFVPVPITISLCSNFCFESSLLSTELQARIWEQRQLRVPQPWGGPWGGYCTGERSDEEGDHPWWNLMTFDDHWRSDIRHRADEKVDTLSIVALLLCDNKPTICNIAFIDSYFIICDFDNLVLLQVGKSRSVRVIAKQSNV